MRRQDRFTDEERAVLESALTHGMTIRGQRQFVRAVDDLVRKMRVSGYTEKQEEAALEKVEHLLLGDAAFAFSMRGVEHSAECRDRHTRSLWRAKRRGKR